MCLWIIHRARDIERTGKPAREYIIFKVRERGNGLYVTVRDIDLAGQALIIEPCLHVHPEDTVILVEREAFDTDDMIAVMHVAPYIRYILTVQCQLVTSQFTIEHRCRHITRDKS